MGLKNLLKDWYIRFTAFKWIVGVADFDAETILGAQKELKIHWIKNNHKCSWFADPFILKETEDYLYILVEEYFYSNHKGRISKLVVNRHNWKLEQIIPVIELSTHLSFPAYYREGGKVYLYPESTKSGKLTLYEYDEETAVLRKCKDISCRALADAVIYDWGGQKVVMATTAPNDNGNILDVYPLSDELTDNPVLRVPFKTNVARNAGLPFRVGEKIIRPAQDCTHSYGSCVVLQEMEIQDSSLSFKEIKRLRSPLFNYREAFHTFNVFENRIIAVDAEGFRFGILAQVVYHIRELFRK